MKTKLLLLFLLLQSVCFAQPSWKPLGYDDFNRAGCGVVGVVGRNKMVAKNGHVFLFTLESGNGTHFSIGKYDGTKWNHIGFPFLFQTAPVIDCAIDGNELPYVLFNDTSTDNLPAVKKYENGNWVNVGTGISTTSSSILNINIGIDNLPFILYREGDVIKLKKYNGTDWVLLAESNEFIPYTSLSLALDKNNIPHIVSNYQVGTTYNCFVKKLVGTNWQEVGITGFSGAGSNLVFDNLNVPYIVEGTNIKKFDGTAWTNIPVQPGSNGFSMAGISQLFFDASNQLNSVYTGTPFHGISGYYYVSKLVNSSWVGRCEGYYSDGTYYTGEGDDLYFLGYNQALRYADVSKVTGYYSRSFLGGSTFNSSLYLSDFSQEKDYQIPDFSMAYNVPWIAYPDYRKAEVRLFTNNDWITFTNVSEADVFKAKVKSDALGNIYVAYNNRISSTLSDTKLTVKKLTTTNWQTVGPTNFSQSAGQRFDFKISHANEPYVLYMNGRVQKFDGTNWVYIGGTAYSGDRPAELALDATDIPYIAYIDPSNSYRISVKRFNSNTNTWDYVDSSGLAINVAIGRHYLPKIIIDGLNNVYVGFTDDSHRLHIKRLNNGAWESVGLDLITTTATDYYDIAVDRTNVLHIAYNELDYFRKSAKVKRFNGSSWEFVGEPNFSADSIVSCKLDFADNNTPILAYGYVRDSYVDIALKYYSESSNPLEISDYTSGNDNEKWHLSPNPASNTFSISGNEAIESVEVYDLTGKKVLTGNIATDINISSLRTGIYVVKIKSDTGTSALKLVKD